LKELAARGSHWILACALLLQACAGVETRQPGVGDEAAYRERAARVGAYGQWGFTGRLSLDDGEDGGSGSLSWNTTAESTALEFRGAMGRGAWQLRITPTGATLAESDGSVHSAPSVETLVRNRIGWAIPVEALAWWVRGLQAPGMVDAAALDADGRLLSLAQFGWDIEFTRYRETGGEALPAKMEARRGQYRVKLAVGRWRLGPGDAE
jgi:outer membrane lipoprotein LolB